MKQSKCNSRQISVAISIHTNTTFEHRTFMLLLYTLVINKNSSSAYTNRLFLQCHTTTKVLSNISTCVIHAVTR
jgi:hypothetical protein